MQNKLDKYFKLTIKHNENHKRCFIYDPQECKAFFANVPLVSDKYITTKSKIKLYYRQPTNIISVPNFHIIQSNASVPLLKSNLQKAIRRQKTDIAVSSALAIIQKDQIEFLRRLPIIYIEDVCLLDSYPISVWLMMVGQDYTLTNLDIFILLKIVNDLCLINNYYDDNLSHNEDKKIFQITHEYLENHVIADQLLALYYRSEYGGMKGDMLMLKNAIYHYYNLPTDMLTTNFNYEIIQNINNSCEILYEAIDFHPFPHIITSLVKQTGLNYEEIKMCIWFAESGVNIRKPETLETSKTYLEGQIWQQIKYKLKLIRFHLLQ